MIVQERLGLSTVVEGWSGVLKLTQIVEALPRMLRGLLAIPRVGERCKGLMMDWDGCGWFGGTKAVDHQECQMVIESRKGLLSSDESSTALGTNPRAPFV